MALIGALHRESAAQACQVTAVRRCRACFGILWPHSLILEKEIGKKGLSRPCQKI